MNGKELVLSVSQLETGESLFLKSYCSLFVILSGKRHATNGSISIEFFIILI